MIENNHESLRTALDEMIAEARNSLAQHQVNRRKSEILLIEVNTLIDTNDAILDNVRKLTSQMRDVRIYLYGDD